MATRHLAAAMTAPSSRYSTPGTAPVRLTGRCAAGHIGAGVNFGKRSPGWERWYDPCASEATCEVISGCVHEHIDRYPSCADCAAKCQEQTNRWRPQCVSCASDHKGCPVQVVVRDLAVVTQ